MMDLCLVVHDGLKIVGKACCDCPLRSPSISPHDWSSCGSLLPAGSAEVGHFVEKAKFNFHFGNGTDLPGISRG
jgi:hypothetical protein